MQMPMPQQMPPPQGMGAISEAELQYLRSQQWPRR
jgi:hypothetical protein